MTTFSNDHLRDIGLVSLGTVLKFGKYEGYSIYWIIKYDTNYVNWLFDNVFKNNDIQVDGFTVEFLNDCITGHLDDNEFERWVKDKRELFYKDVCQSVENEVNKIIKKHKIPIESFTKVGITYDYKNLEDEFRKEKKMNPLMYIPPAPVKIIREPSPPKEKKKKEKVESAMEIMLKEIRKEDKETDNTGVQVEIKKYVYLIKDHITGYIKIGYSKNPMAREGTLQAEKPTLEIIHLLDGDLKFEKSLHQKYKEKRLRGEWFNLTTEDIGCILTEHCDKIVSIDALKTKEVVDK